MNAKIKVGLSLLIAMAFILPSGSILAEANEAEVNEIETNTFVEKSAIGLNQAPGDVISEGVKMVNPNGDELMLPGTFPVEDFYGFQSGLFVEQIDNEQTAEIQSGLSLYSIDEGVEVLMYETSFEDNFDIYNNWMQVDLDCGTTPTGETGFFDSWSWSDARASDGDHSMKNTMYPVYKGNQNDILQCTKVFDMCDQYYYNVSFDIWVEGQWYDTFMVPPPENYYDFVSFQMSTDGGMTWDEVGIPYADTTMPLKYRGWNITSFVEDIGDGWWNVEHQFVVTPGECEEVMFRFEWISDPELQYEGAYIDNFEVISIEGVEEKIWQTFTQDCTEVPVNTPTFVDYPLNWEDVEPGDYYVKYWVEVEDCNPEYESEFPKPGIIIPFCIEDVQDCEVKDLVVEDSFTHSIIPDDGNMPYGSDAHIMYTFCNNGNIPIEDVPINLDISKKIWDQIYFWDAENSMQIFESYGEVGLDDYQSKDGDKSLYFGNPDTKSYDADAFAYATLGKVVNWEENEQVILEFDWRALTDENDDIDWTGGAGSASDGSSWPYGDFIYPYILDAHNNIVAGFGYYYETPAHWDYVIGGFNPDWQHYEVDMKPVYEYLKASGYFADAYGNAVNELQIGFLMLTDMDEVNYCELGDALGYDEAGIWIDNVEITTLGIGETVFEDSMVLPGPIEPGECVDAQFEWEDVPYSHYKITVSNECDDPAPYDTNDEVSQQILVTSDLERADNKNVEGVDYTGTGDGEWSISSSDWDNYLATNHDQHYPSWANSVAILAPEHETCTNEEYCIDVSDLEIHDTVVNVLSEDFTGGWPAGWNNPGSEFFYHPGNEAGGAAAGQGDVNSGSITLPGATTTTPTFDLSALDTATLSFVQEVDWISGTFNINVDAWDGSTWTSIYTNPVTGDFGGAGVPVTISVPTTTTQLRFRISGVDAGELGYWVFDDVSLDGVINAIDSLTLEMNAWWDLEAGYDFVYLEIADGCNESFPATEADWTTITGFSGFQDFTDETVDLAPYVTGDTFALRFRLESDMGGQGRGMKITELAIMNGAEYIFGVDTDDDGVYDAPDPMDTMDNWCTDNVHWGDYWSDGPSWCIDPIPLIPIDNAIVWETEINDAYEAYLSIDLDYFLQDVYVADFFGLPVDDDVWFKFIAELQISIDGGETWTTLDVFEGSDSGIYNYDLSEFAGNDILIRIIVSYDGQITGFALEGLYGYTPESMLLWYGHYFMANGGYFCINDMFITGKKDTTAPESTITMSGTMADSGWYSTPVSVTITATDDNCVKEIHYILDGSETVVSGNKATFTISENGAHDLSFWAVDCVGNVESTNTVPTFRIDSGSPPTVAITAPEPGLYLFGNKLLSLSKVMIIGAFTAEATASDAESGIYRVQFLLDGDIVAEDTEAPFSAYIAEKHMGAGTLSVVAEDFSGNTAEDSLDITYYKFL